MVKTHRGHSPFLALCILLPELVVFTDGRFLKVTDFKHEKNTYHLTLPSGGIVSVPEGRVEQIVSDEITEEKQGLSPGLSDRPDSLDLQFVKSGSTPDIPYWELIENTGRHHNLNPFLIASLARAESNFNPSAVSPKGAIGIMQLMPSTCQRFKAADPFDVNQNLDGAARFIVYLRKKFNNNLTNILAAYNSGEHTVEKYDGPPPYRETLQFVTRVRSFFLAYMGEFIHTDERETL